MSFNMHRCPKYAKNNTRSGTVRSLRLMSLALASSNCAASVFVTSGDTKPKEGEVGGVDGHRMVRVREETEQVKNIFIDLKKVTEESMTVKSWNSNSKTKSKSKSERSIAESEMDETKSKKHDTKSKKEPKSTENETKSSATKAKAKFKAPKSLPPTTFPSHEVLDVMTPKPVPKPVSKPTPKPIRITSSPTSILTNGPSSSPTFKSSAPLSTKPSSSKITMVPSHRPAGSGQPSFRPSHSGHPTLTPSESGDPTLMPSQSGDPTLTPSDSSRPSGSPSDSGRPSESPSDSGRPSESPSDSGRPSDSPSDSGRPSDSPSNSGRPSDSPSDSGRPSDSPSNSGRPSNSPSESVHPTGTPSESTKPSLLPSESNEPSQKPSQLPSSEPSESVMPSTAPATPVTPCGGTADVGILACEDGHCHGGSNTDVGVCVVANRNKQAYVRGSCNTDSDCYGVHLSNGVYYERCRNELRERYYFEKCYEDGRGYKYCKYTGYEEKSQLPTDTPDDATDPLCLNNICPNLDALKKVCGLPNACKCYTK